MDEADERVIDKENVDPVPFHLQNPKVHRGKGRPVGTKRFKSAHGPSKLNSKQRRCKNVEMLVTIKKIARFDYIIV